MTNSTLPLGIDVASYQGYPDWGQVANSGVKFGITKATERTDYTNPTFAHNWHNMKEHGVIRGAYHFARPSVNPDARREADYFFTILERVGGLETGDLVVLDMEDENAQGDMGPWTLYFLEIMESYIGFKPILYTGPWYINSWSLDETKLGEYPLWLAAYQANMPVPPKPWDVISIWQYSSSGRIPGIQGDVDVNRFNGTIDRLPLLGKPGATPVPEPEPVPTKPDYTKLKQLIEESASNANTHLSKLRDNLRVLEEQARAHHADMANHHDALEREIERLESS